MIKKQTKNFYTQACLESLTPIRPGVEGLHPFWNWNSRRFIYAPVFGPPAETPYPRRIEGFGGFRKVPRATAYHFKAMSASTGATFAFQTSMPHVSLAPIWKKLPTDVIFLAAHAVDSKGHALGLSGFRQFYKAPVFNGPYGMERADYKRHGLRMLEYLHNLAFVRKWRTQKKPDYEAYGLYCYPSKMIGAMMRFVNLSYGMAGGDRKQQIGLLAMGRNMADFMMNASLKSGPLAGMPPTYRGDKASARGNNDKLFMLEPIGVAEGYLAIYAITHEQKYLEAALRIADVYRRQQTPDGTWYAMHKFDKTGEPLSRAVPIFCPLSIIRFLTRLMHEHGQSRNVAAIEKATRYLEKNVLEPFNFSGQFEDSGYGRERYRNLGAPPTFACVLWLLQEHTPAKVKRAEEIMRFGEDQFVVWEKAEPAIVTPKQDWLTPCVMEQSTDCYMPVSASAGMAAKAFLKLYQLTGKPIHRAKAVSLANSFVRAQAPNGFMPTFWTTEDIECGKRGVLEKFWFNCGFSDACFLIDFAAALHNID